MQPCITDSVSAIVVPSIVGLASVHLRLISVKLFRHRTTLHRNKITFAVHRGSTYHALFQPSSSVISLPQNRIAGARIWHHFSRARAAAAHDVLAHAHSAQIHFELRGLQHCCNAVNCQFWGVSQEGGQWRSAGGGPTYCMYAGVSASAD